MTHDAICKFIATADVEICKVIFPVGWPTHSVTYTNMGQIKARLLTLASSNIEFLRFAIGHGRLKNIMFVNLPENEKKAFIKKLLTANDDALIDLIFANLELFNLELFSKPELKAMVISSEKLAHKILVNAGLCEQFGITGETINEITDDKMIDVFIEKSPVFAVDLVSPPLGAKLFSGNLKFASTVLSNEKLCKQFNISFEVVHELLANPERTEYSQKLFANINNFYQKFIADAIAVMPAEINTDHVPVLKQYRQPPMVSNQPQKTPVSPGVSNSNKVEKPEDNQAYKLVKKSFAISGSYKESNYEKVYKNKDEVIGIYTVANLYPESFTINLLPVEHLRNNDMRTTLQTVIKNGDSFALYNYFISINKKISDGNTEANLKFLHVELLNSYLLRLKDSNVSLDDKLKSIIYLNKLLEIYTDNKNFVMDKIKAFILQSIENYLRNMAEKSLQIDVRFNAITDLLKLINVNKDQYEKDINEKLVAKLSQQSLLEEIVQGCFSALTSENTNQLQAKTILLQLLNLMPQSIATYLIEIRKIFENNRNLFLQLSPVFVSFNITAQAVSAVKDKAVSLSFLQTAALSEKWNREDILLVANEPELAKICLTYSHLYGNTKLTNEDLFNLAKTAGYGTTAKDISENLSRSSIIKSGLLKSRTDFASYLQEQIEKAQKPAIKVPSKQAAPTPTPKDEPSKNTTAVNSSSDKNESKEPVTERPEVPSPPPPPYLPPMDTERDNNSSNAPLLPPSTSSNNNSNAGKNSLMDSIRNLGGTDGLKKKKQTITNDQQSQPANTQKVDSDNTKVPANNETEVVPPQHPATGDMFAEMKKHKLRNATAPVKASANAPTSTMSSRQPPKEEPAVSNKPGHFKIQKTEKKLNFKELLGTSFAKCNAEAFKHKVGSSERNAFEIHAHHLVARFLRGILEEIGSNQISLATLTLEFLTESFKSFYKKEEEEKSQQAKVASETQDTQRAKIINEERSILTRAFNNIIIDKLVLYILPILQAKAKMSDENKIQTSSTQIMSKLKQTKNSATNANSSSNANINSNTKTESVELDKTKVEQTNEEQTQSIPNNAMNSLQVNDASAANQPADATSLLSSVAVQIERRRKSMKEDEQADEEQNSDNEEWNDNKEDKQDHGGSSPKLEKK